MDKSNFKAAAAFAFEGFSRRASEWWLAALGGFAGWVFLRLSGLQRNFDSVLPTNALVANAIVIVICVMLGELLMLAVRFVYFPLHLRTKPHGGLLCLAKVRLGPLMAPIFLILFGVFAFVISFSAGAIWLLLRLPDNIAAKTLSLSAEGALQPNYSLEPSKNKLLIKWDPVKSSEIRLRYEGDEGSSFTTPGFNVRNDNSTGIADVTVKWRAEATGLDQLVMQSPNFSTTKNRVSDDQIIVNYQQPGSWAFSYKMNEVQYQLPFISKNTTINLPLPLYDIACLYFVAKMPEKNGETSDPIVFSLFLNWNIPAGGKEQEFKIKAAVTNNKIVGISRPQASGVIDFTITRVK